MVEMFTVELHILATKAQLEFSNPIRVSEETTVYQRIGHGYFDRDVSSMMCFVS